MNNIIIKGRLTADPELKITPNGVSVCSFSVAVDRSYKKDGERQADFFNVNAWRGTAEFVEKYFRKGQEILICGEMQSRRYKDKDNNNRTVWEVIASSVEFCGSSNKSESKATGDIDVEMLPDDEDNLPF